MKSIDGILSTTQSRAEKNKKKKREKAQVMIHGDARWVYHLSQDFGVLLDSFHLCMSVCSVYQT